MAKLIIFAVVVALAVLALAFWLVRSAHGSFSRHSALANYLAGVLSTVALGVVPTYVFMVASANQGHRTEHLARLRLVLAKEADVFGEVARQVRDQGWYGDADHQAVERAVRGQLDGDVLGGDLKNHFSQYGEQRSAFRGALVAYHQRLDLFLEQVASAAAAATGSPEGMQSTLAGALVATKCLGHDAGPRLVVTAKDWTYSWGRNGGGGTMTGAPPRKILDEYRWFTSFSFDEQAKAECQGLAAQGAALVAVATSLRQQALEAAERTTLDGACPYLPTWASSQ